jgi:hypothetical protein
MEVIGLRSDFRVTALAKFSSRDPQSNAIADRGNTATANYAKESISSSGSFLMRKMGRLAMSAVVR